MAIERITSVDRNTKIVEYDTSNVQESLDKTWIISGDDIFSQIITNVSIAANTQFISI
jgi:hypothetical protein